MNEGSPTDRRHKSSFSTGKSIILSTDSERRLSPIGKKDVSIDLSVGYVDGSSSAVVPLRRTGRSGWSGILGLSRSNVIDDRHSSVFKQSEPLEMLVDSRYYLQHPNLRLFFVIIIPFLNFLSNTQEPSYHSRVNANLLILADVYQFIFTKYPTDDWIALKVGLWVSSIIFGILFGHFIMHKLIFNRLLKLEMFKDKNLSRTTTLITTILTIYIFSQIYNAILSLASETTSQYKIDNTIDISASMMDINFVTSAATWFADFMTASLVADFMLQEKLYPMWCTGVRKWWKTKNRRIYVFWSMLIISSLLVLIFLYVYWLKFEFNDQFININTELWRACLASSILIIDLAIIMQDWDFPHFLNPLKINLPGVHNAHILINIAKLHLSVDITAKGLNYGILAIVIYLDFNHWYSIMTYNPSLLGQYIDPNDRIIYTIEDSYTLRNLHNKTLTSFEFRNNNIDSETGKLYINGDKQISARYLNHGYWYQVICGCVVALVCLLFVFFVIKYGRYRKPTVDFPYIGRVKTEQDVPQEFLRDLERTTPKRCRCCCFKDGVAKSVSRVSTGPPLPTIHMTPIEDLSTCSTSEDQSVKISIANMTEESSSPNDTESSVASIISLRVFRAAFASTK